VESGVDKGLPEKMTKKGALHTDFRNSVFINKILNFLGVGLALYAVASTYEWASNDSIIKHTVKCKYCRKRISVKVHSLLILDLEISIDI
jgi:hypothetical protein